MSPNRKSIDRLGDLRKELDKLQAEYNKLRLAVLKDTEVGDTVLGDDFQGTVKIQRRRSLTIPALEEEFGVEWVNERAGLIENLALWIKPK